MMLHILWAEILKFKNSKMLWLIPTGAIFPPLSAFLVSLARENPRAVVWEKYFSNTLMLTNIVLIAFYSILTGFIFCREYEENNDAFVYPISKITILFSKLILMALAVVVFFHLSFMITLLLGYLRSKGGMSAGAIWTALKIVLYTTPMHFALVPVAAAVAMLGRRLLVPTIYGVFSVILALLSLDSMYCSYIPWCAPAVAALKMAGSQKENIILAKDSTVLALLSMIFIGSLLFCIIYYIRADKV